RGSVRNRAPGDLSWRETRDMPEERAIASERLPAMTRSQRLLAGFFAFAGTMHFVIPRSYEAMMPPSVPRHREAVAVSGIAEILGGAAMLGRSTRRFARWWLLTLLLAVFPANVHMAINPEQVRGQD